MEDLLYKVALSRIDGVGPVTARQLLAKFGDARAVFEAHPRELVTVPGVTEGIARHIPKGEALALAEFEVEQIERYDLQVHYIADASYPDRLRHLDYAPILLYYKGTASLNALRTVGIIGTRKPSPFGQAQVERLVAELLPYQPMIISGLAHGIDIAGHRAALQQGLHTIGVLGHGLRYIYPVNHRSTAEAMLEQGGLLTEYPFLTQADPRHFPMRNRIVAGLCDALVVVESPRKGGSIITAEFANLYNRDVFAVPGRLHDRTSEGCNWLIKTHKAALLEHGDDIAYVLRWATNNRPVTEQLKLFDTLTEDEKIVVNLLRNKENLHIDELAFQTQMPSGLLATVLLEMECKGMLRTLPGKRYLLVR